jgi:hypothetical protein
MTRMNWDKVNKENRMRRSGAIRTMTEEDLRRLKAKRERRKTRAARKQAAARGNPSGTRRLLETCPLCGAFVRASRYASHVRSRCSKRPDASPQQAAPTSRPVHKRGVSVEIRARIVRRPGDSGRK